MKSEFYIISMKKKKCYSSFNFFQSSKSVKTMSACPPPTTSSEPHLPGGPSLTHPSLEKAGQQQIKQLLSWEENRNSAIPVLPLPGSQGRRGLNPGRPWSHRAQRGRLSVARQSCRDEQQLQQHPQALESSHCWIQKS